MKKQGSDPFEDGLMIILIPILVIAIGIGLWTHDSKKGFEFYQKSLRFIFPPLFQPLEKAVQK